MTNQPPIEYASRTVDYDRLQAVRQREVDWNGAFYPGERDELGSLELAAKLHPLSGREAQEILERKAIPVWQPISPTRALLALERKRLPR